MTLNYDFKERLASLARADRIRVTRLFEAVQFCVIYSALFFVAAAALDRTLARLFPAEEQVLPNWLRTVWELVVALFQVVLNVLLVFYIRKLALLVPPLVNLDSSHYRASWHVEEAQGEMALAIVAIGVQTNLLDRLAGLRRRLFGK